MRNVVNKLVSELSQYNPVVTTAPTGSVYITFTGSKVKQVRVSNHAGHKLKRNTIDLRSDAMTCRKKNVYNVRDVNLLIKSFK